MAKRLNDDLFEGTTMSFGSHLEELRKALFKSMIYLVIGSLAGMAVSHLVVRAVQGPLERSLKKFYINKATEALQARYPKSKYPNGVPKQVIDFIDANKLTPEEWFVEKSMLPKFATDKGSSTRDGNQVDKEPPREAETPVAETAVQDEAQSPPEEPVAWWNSIYKFFGYGAEEELQTDLESNLDEIVSEQLPSPDPNMIKLRIWRPLDIRITSLSAQEVFMIWMKAAFISGLVMASPLIFYEIWNFVAAGLYPHEKNYVYLYLPFSLGLFLAGAALAFFFVFDPVLEFLFKFNKTMGIDPDPRINEWLGFVLYLPLGFGVSFQLPLVLLFLNRIGIFSVEAYLSKWRIAILSIFFISMVLTPADPVSMMLMACPLTFLYFFGVALCRWMPRGRNPFDAGYEP